MAREITCVSKRDRPNIHEHIASVGGGTGDTRWRKTQLEVITDIENKWDSYYVVWNRMRIQVIIATSIYGHKYIKTETDGIRADNLLNLPECT
jgi:hypothetical protein